MGALANCLGVLLLCFVVSSCSFDNDDCLPSSLESSKLKMVIVITRHGDRTPLTFFPNTKSEWPEERGQLTGLGMKQHYELGRKFRELYIEEHKLLRPSYQPTEVVARSTQKDRTMRSAQSFLLGLYPPGTGPLLPSADGEGEAALPYGLDVIPIHSVPLKFDSVLYAYKNCPRLKRMKKAFLNNPLYLKKVEQHQELLQELSEILGKELQLQDLTAVSSLSRAERIHNRLHTLNNTYWTKKEKDIDEVRKFVLSHKFANHFMGQLGVGALPKEIQMRFEDRVKDEGARFVLLSAHDGGLLSLFAFLQAKYDELPSYADYITFELYEKGDSKDGDKGRNGYRNEEYRVPKGQFFVKIRYKDLPLSTPACVGGIEGDKNSERSDNTGVCDLAFFLDYLEESRLEDWPIECLRDENNLEIVSYTYSPNVTKILDFVEPLHLDLLEG